MGFSLTYYEENEDAQVEQGAQTTYTRNLMGLTSEVVGAEDLRLHTKTPKPYDRHPQNSNAQVTSVEPKQIKNAPLIWRVTVNYSTTQIQGIEGEYEAQELELSPLERRARITLRWVSHTRRTFVDAEGNPIVNTAGDLLEAIEVEDDRLVISVEKMVSPGFPPWIDGFANATNDADLTIRGRRLRKETLMFKNLVIPSADEAESEYGIPFVRLGYELHHRKETWREDYLNRGYNERAEIPDPCYPGTGIPPMIEVLQAILLADDEKPRAPLFLDSDGKAFRHSCGLLGVKPVIRTPAPDEVVKVNVRKYKTLKFGRLPGIKD